jgi:hypothetical protein
MAYDPEKEPRFQPRRPTRHLSAIELRDIYIRVMERDFPGYHLDPHAIGCMAALVREAVAEFARLNGLDPVPGG